MNEPLLDFTLVILASIFVIALIAQGVKTLSLNRHKLTTPQIAFFTLGFVISVVGILLTLNDPEILDNMYYGIGVTVAWTSLIFVDEA